MTTAHADIDYDALDREDAQRRARLNSPTALTDAARWYAETARWPVFPLVAGGKRPVIPKAHPEDDELQESCKGACGHEGHGLYDATTDMAVVANWWRRWPSANIGTRTGLTFDVIDIDGPEGFLSLAKMWHIGCPPDCCAEGTCRPDRSKVLDHDILAKAYTGGGGRHLLIAPTGQPNGTRITDGIDYRGDGGYIVLPPSRHESGGVYDWLTPPDDRSAGQRD